MSISVGIKYNLHSPQRGPPYLLGHLQTPPLTQDPPFRQEKLAPAKQLQFSSQFLPLHP